MATTLTKQNLANIFDRILEQYDTFKAAQDVLYAAISECNVDLASHYSYRGEGDIESPLILALQNFREYSKVLQTSTDAFGRYPEFRNLFNAFSTYFRTETVLTDKTINGFMAYNDLKVSDKVNKIYFGITGTYLQARNVLPQENYVFATTSAVTGVTPPAQIPVISNPDQTFSNATYVPTSTTGKQYTPFPIKIVPSQAVVSPIGFSITWSDDTVTTYTNITVPLTGLFVSTYHSGIKSFTLTAGNIDGITFSFITNFTYIKHLLPLGWCTALEDAIQLYITNTEGTRIYFGNSQFVPKDVALWLYLRIKPSLLGDLGGTWFNDGLQWNVGTEDPDGWFVNEVEVTPSSVVEIQAKSFDIAPPYTGPVNYIFTAAVDGSLDNQNNYNPVGIPTSEDSVDFTGKTIASGTLVCDSAVFSGTTINGGTFTVTQGIFLTNGSQTGASVVLGTATFIDSVNYGTVTTAIFQSDAASSFNFGTCASATFASTCYNGNETTSGTCENATFNGTTNYSIVTGTASFTDSVNAASGNCHYGIFQSSSRNEGICDVASFYPSGSPGSWTYPQNMGGTITTAQCYWNSGDSIVGGTVTNTFYWGYIDYPNPSTDFTYTDNGTDITITGYIGTDYVDNVVIPSTINGKPVTEIYGSFESLSVVALWIPDSVIGTISGGFNFSYVRFPSGITGLGDSLFYSRYPSALFFEGNAPTLGTEAITNMPTICVRAGTTGWDDITWSGFTKVVY